MTDVERQLAAIQGLVEEVRTGQFTWHALPMTGKDGVTLQAYQGSNAVWTVTAIQWKRGRVEVGYVGTAVSSARGLIANLPPEIAQVLHDKAVATLN